ncbi:MAG TPA: fatty acid--CoA ligase [Desulfobacterales bacterium]|nr:fatty acid--CoA ligase [Desulfobacterales bacterium]
MNLYDGLRHQAKLNPSAPAVSCGDAQYTYGQFNERVLRLGNALTDQGVRKGDRVATLLLNCHRYLELYYATAVIGVTIVPLNYRLAPKELEYIMNDSESGTLFTDENFLQLIEPVMAELKSLKRTIFTSGVKEVPDGMLDYETLIAESSTGMPSVTVEEEDLSGIFYTGGTTGLAKGVMLSHRNLRSNAYHNLMNFPFENGGEGEVYCHAAPMFHLANGAAMYANVIHGSKHTFVKMFDPKVLLELIQKERITMVILVPAMINFVVNYPEVGNYDISSLRTIVYGAAPMPVELLKKAMEVIGCDFIQGYGMTETSPTLTILYSDEHHTEGPEKLTRRLLSCGREIIGVEVRIVNEDGQDVKPGEVGEIIARGPNIMQGYWKKEAETEAVLKNGWYYTGDIGTIDDEHYIFLLDRKKDMIISGGENVYSTEVENAIYTHPAVLEAAVIGVPDEKWGEAVKGIVVLKPGAEATAEEIIEHCRDSIAGYKVPKSIEFMDELPKSGAGKILKRDLREKYYAGRERRIS